MVAKKYQSEFINNYNNTEITEVLDIANYTIDNNNIEKFTNYAKFNLEDKPQDNNSDLGNKNLNDIII